MTEKIRVIRPGLLVSLATSIRGNSKYITQELETKHIDPKTGEERARWETLRLIADPAEHDRAVKLRSSVRYTIQRVCASAGNHLLCPLDRREELLEAVDEAKRLVAEFNETAVYSYISISVYIGEVAQDEATAVKAISSELRDLMEDMENGLKRLDANAVRKAANKAKTAGEMLSPDAQARLEVAIKAAREGARKIVKAGEVVGLEIDRVALAQIDMARTSFLDIDTAAIEVEQPTMDGRALDLPDDDDKGKKAS